MKNLLVAILSLTLFFISCKKENTPVSGQATIDNKVYQSGTYYTFGFSFDLAKKVSTLNNPEPDFTVDAGVLNGETEESAYFAANTLNPSFSLFDQCNSTEEALTTFNLLKSFGVRTWTDMGTHLAKNQIWLIRTGKGNYAKVWITDLTTDSSTEPTFVSCTFKWVYQPDGSTTFTE